MGAGDGLGDGAERTEAPAVVFKRSIEDADDELAAFVDLADQVPGFGQADLPRPTPVGLCFPPVLRFGG
jgi:hypothetical protein